MVSGLMERVEWNQAVRREREIERGREREVEVEVERE